MKKESLSFAIFSFFIHESLVNLVTVVYSSDFVSLISTLHGEKGLKKPATWERSSSPMRLCKTVRLLYSDRICTIKGYGYYSNALVLFHASVTYMLVLYREDSMNQTLLLHATTTRSIYLRVDRFIFGHHLNSIADYADNLSFLQYRLP
jgi:hypothetical protein